MLQLLTKENVFDKNNANTWNQISITASKMTNTNIIDICLQMQSPLHLNLLLLYPTPVFVLYKKIDLTHTFYS